MTATHAEIVELLAEEIEQIARSCISRVQRRKRLDEEDDDHASLVDLLDRWGDRKVTSKERAEIIERHKCWRIKPLH